MVKILVALLASLLTGVQTYLIYTQGKGICFNEGCEIVEKLTLVPPLYFNLAGFLFFQVVFWCFLLGRRGVDYLTKFANLLLLGGVCAEAVLIFFQYSIANTFCSYCLIVCFCILFLNLICGLKQIFRGAVLFASVLAALFALQFDFGSGGTPKSLKEGSIAWVSGATDRPELTLFFSATCPHCEAVIDSLKSDNVCTVRFNPIERIENFAFSKAETTKQYDPLLNLSFLENLSLKEIPVLAAREKGETRIIKGEAKIIGYLEEHCRTEKIIDYGSGMSSSAPGFVVPAPYQLEQDDGCRVDINCDPAKPGTPQGN